jgi:hypothetical protein
MLASFRLDRRLCPLTIFLSRCGHTVPLSVRQDSKVVSRMGRRNYREALLQILQAFYEDIFIN